MYAVPSVLIAFTDPVAAMVMVPRATGLVMTLAVPAGALKHAKDARVPPAPVVSLPAYPAMPGNVHAPAPVEGT